MRLALRGCRRGGRLGRLTVSSGLATAGVFPLAETLVGALNADARVFMAASFVAQARARISFVPSAARRGYRVGDTIRLGVGACSVCTIAVFLVPVPARGWSHGTRP